MAALTLNNPPRRDSQKAVISSTSAKLIKVQSLYSSTSSNPPNASKKKKKLLSSIRESLNIKLIRKFNIFWPEHIFFLSCQMSLGRLCSASQSEATGGEKAPAGAMIVEFGPVLASGPITQLTCLLTRRPYLCCTACSAPGCLYSWGLFAKSKC